MFSKIINKLKSLPKPAIIGGLAAIGLLVVGFAAFEIWRTFSPTTIKGIDVSHYQGDISWRAVAESGEAKFIYIKATEGKSYQDPSFKKNWHGVSEIGLPAGAYHFYSQSSSGADQAANFIATVPKEKGNLPPAIDIEGNVTKQKNFKSELADYVRAVTKHYGQKPIFYVPYRVYNLLYDDYYGYTFWIIDYDGQPNVNGWTFWQYSNKSKIAGVSSKVDFDEYHGSRWDFNKLISR